MGHKKGRKRKRVGLTPDAIDRLVSPQTQEPKPAQRPRPAPKPKPKAPDVMEVGIEEFARHHGIEPEAQIARHGRTSLYHACGLTVEDAIDAEVEARTKERLKEQRYDLLRQAPEGHIRSTVRDVVEPNFRRQYAYLKRRGIRPKV